MTKSKLPPPSRPVPFFQRKDWLLSAGLVLVIYILMLLMMHLYIPESRYLKYLVHLLPALALGMAWRGIKDRDEELSRGRASKAKRRHAEMHLKKLEKSQAPAGADSAGEEKKK